MLPSMSGSYGGGVAPIDLKLSECSHRSLAVVAREVAGRVGEVIANRAGVL
jgi:hypothetical protein